MNNDENFIQDGFNITPVFTACMIYGNSMSSLDYATFKPKGKGKNEEVEGHNLTRLLMDNVNSYMTPADWFTTMMFHWGITGNAMSYIVRDRMGRPKELIPLDPHDLVRVELVRGIKKFHYGVEGRIILDEDMFHISGPGWDGIMGKNPIEAHRDVFGTSAHMQRYVNKFFEHGANPKSVLETDEILDDEEHKNLMTSWHATFSGPNNAGKTVILENGMKLKPLAMNPMDVAYLAVSGDVKKTIANIYRLPLYMFNEFKEGAQYDNVESQELALIKHAISPMATKWEQEIKRKLIPAGSKEFGRFDLFSLARGDMKTISDYAGRFFTIGTLNQDEIRGKYLKMNPLPDNLGQRYYVQGNNMVPVDKVDQLYEDRLNGNKAPGEGGRPDGEKINTDLPSIKEN